MRRPADERQPATASGEIQTVMSPRCVSARSYAAQSRTRYRARCPARIRRAAITRPRQVTSLQADTSLDPHANAQACTTAGETHFQHALPLDRSSMTRWRQRIGPERLELLLAESVAAAQRGGAVADKHLRRVTIDTTVQPKAVTHPTDSKLLNRGIEILARLARRHGIRLRQSYLRVARRARREAARLIHAGRRRQAERQVRQLRTWLGRLFRDIGRKVAGKASAEAALAAPLGLVARLLRQRREDRGRDKLYSLHAPEVECIGKGKANARYEFGVKVSLATTNAVAPGGQFVLGARALPGIPFDGHTLAAQIAQAERITGVEVERAYVDRGYRGHDADRTRVFVSGQKRRITPTIRRERRRRSAIEPVIGHMKSDGHLGRNLLLGTEGDATNLVLAAALLHGSLDLELAGKLARMASPRLSGMDPPCRSRPTLSVGTTSRGSATG
ncbi:IS5 family transposase [Paracraurococcus ruber]|uniref:IS5 family transposase n=2 Tax=Paracraurococcus ruber TaxID=77675 RepID=UPI0034E03004